MKKKSKPKTKKYTGPTLYDRLPKDQGEWLELCIKITERAIKNNAHQKFLVNQLDRIKKRLAEWRANESQNQKTSP